MARAALQPGEMGAGRCRTLKCDTTKRTVDHAAASRIMRREQCETPPRDTMMPVIAIVAGVAIRLYYGDHEPAHFHAVLAGDEMLVRIADLAVMAGSLPPAQRRAVLEWAAGNQDALALAWIRCRQGEKPGRIA